MPTVLLAGAFGQRNPGDEALLDAFLRTLPEWRVVVTSSEPAMTTATHNCEAVHSQQPDAVGRALLSADAVVFAGGTVFKTLHQSSGRPAHGLLRRALLLAATARLTGKPVALVGVGVGSLPDAQARWLARALVRRSDLLVLRDEESAHALAAVGAPVPFRVGADPAWTLLDGPPNPTSAQQRDTVVVALSIFAGGDDLADRLATALRPIVDSGARVELQPWQGSDAEGGDGGLARAIAARLGSRVGISAPPIDLEDARNQMTGARLAVCLRFHAVVAAAAAGTPLVAIAHEPKLAGLARRLHQPNVPITAAPAEIAATILGGLDVEPSSPAAVRVEIARAAESLRLLRLVLTRGAAYELVGFDGLSLEPATWAAT
jgi:polysaccharide pyruvyl transferase CsaB